MQLQKIKNQEENMNKAPRFMKEYAKYKTLNILRNELMKEELKCYTNVVTVVANKI